MNLYTAIKQQPPYDRWLVFLREPYQSRFAVILPNGDVLDLSSDEIVISLELFDIPRHEVEKLLDYAQNFYAVKWEIGSEIWEKLTVEQARAYSPNMTQRVVIG